MPYKYKSTGTAYILFFLFLLGFAGIHRFYIGKIGTGLLYLLTWGFLGIGLIYDLFTLARQVTDANIRYDYLYNRGQKF
ncbi:NINE protein [Micromonospora provocatoris]